MQEKNSYPNQGLVLLDKMQQDSLFESWFHWMDAVSTNGEFFVTFPFVATFDSSCENSLTASDLSPQENRLV